MANREPFSGIAAIPRTIAVVGLFCGFFLLVKLFVVDTYSIQTHQMEPTLLNGDRVITIKIRYSFPFRLFLKPRHDDMCVFTGHDTHQRSCLRVFALPGDTVSIIRGIPYRNGQPRPDFEQDSLVVPLSAEYSPRDAMTSFILPLPGTTIALDELSLRDFIFYASMYRQEKPHDTVYIQPELYLDGELQHHYTVERFTLFNGDLDSIPYRHHFNWFFWDRLLAFLTQEIPDRDVALRWRLYRDEKRISHYTVKKSFIFFLADDWTSGFDSRYFGPVSTSRILGSICCVLWSFDPEAGGLLNRLRSDRILKFLSHTKTKPDSLLGKSSEVRGQRSEVGGREGYAVGRLQGRRV